MYRFFPVVDDLRRDLAAEVDSQVEELAAWLQAQDAG